MGDSLATWRTLPPSDELDRVIALAADYRFDAIPDPEYDGFRPRSIHGPLLYRCLDSHGGVVARAYNEHTNLTPRFSREVGIALLLFKGVMGWTLMFEREFGIDRVTGYSFFVDGIVFSQFEQTSALAVSRGFLHYHETIIKVQH